MDSQEAGFPLTTPHGRDGRETGFMGRVGEAKYHLFTPNTRLKNGLWLEHCQADEARPFPITKIMFDPDEPVQASTPPAAIATKGFKKSC